ncbi:MAG: helix-turn-helix domain-containing protein [Ramlibacter sp.]
MKQITPNPCDANRLMTVAEVASQLQVSTRTVRRLIAADELKVVRIGRAIRIHPADLKAYVTGAAGR